MNNNTLDHKDLNHLHSDDGELPHTTPAQAKRTSKKPMIWMLIGVGILFGGIFGFQAFKMYMMGKMIATMKMPPVTISAMDVTSQPWQPKIQAAGTVRAIHGVDVTTEIAGLVKTILFQPGATVKKGDLLIELSSDTDIAQLNALKASADLADTVYKRDKSEYSIKAISKATLDADSADLKNKQALVAQQEAVLAKKTIRAPFDGRLGINAVNLGQYLNPGDKIVTLQSLDPIYVDFSVPQQVLSKVSVGQTVTLTSDSFPGRSFAGKISTIEPQIDTNTRNIRVEATVPNPDHALLPGMFATTETITGVPTRYMTVPQTAVSFNPYGEVMFIIQEKDGKLIANQTFVTVGEKRGDQVAVLTGIKEGDKVVTNGQLKLKNGSEVVINNKIEPANNPNPKVEEE